MQTEKLFGEFHHAFFRVLSGRNRHVYAEVLFDLHKVFGDEGGEDEYSRDTIKSVIADTLRRLEVVALEEEDDIDPEEAQEPDPPSRAYARLRACGWLTEDRAGYRYVATMPFAASDLLSTLCRIRERQHDRYGVRVFSIFNNLRTATQSNEAHIGAALVGAARESLEFGRHLRQMANDVRSVVDLVAEMTEHRDIMRAFFERFVRDFLVADYTLLKTAQNPFRYRADVVGMVNNIQYLPELRDSLARSLLEMENRPLEHLPHALQEVDRCCSQILRSFSRIDDRLAKIDVSRARLETKARNLVLYAATTTPGAAGRIDNLLKRLMHISPETLSELEIGSVVPLSTAHAYSEHTLATPKAKRKPVAPTKFRSNRRDTSAAEARRAVIKAYLDRIKPSPAAVRSYLVRITDSQPTMEAADFPVNDLDSLVMFLTISGLNPKGVVNRRTLRGFELEKLPGVIENEYAIVPNFRLRRVGVFNAE